MASAPPAFPFYAQDFYMGTLSFNNELVGAYVRLLITQWLSGGIPDNEANIAQTMLVNRRSFRRIWSKLRSKFVLGSDGLWRNVRLEEVRQKQREYNALQAEKGAKGGRRKAQNRLAGASSRLQPKRSLSSSSSSSSSSEDLKNAAAPRAHPVEKSRRPKGRPKVSVLAAMICEEIFPMGFMSIADQADAAKARAAKLGLPYDSRSIANALASAQAQVAKGLRYDS